MGEGKVKSPLIASDGVELTEVDVKGFGKNEMKDLLDRLMKIPEKDNEGFLLKLKQRLDRYHESRVLVLQSSSSFLREMARFNTYLVCLICTEILMFELFQSWT